MTDKQIIIDGIDVSKCKYIDIENFEKPICHCITQRNECKMPCEYNKDCYYKQLARKEQECEELKNAYTRLNSLYNDNCNFTDKLEQTLTEIKEIAKKHKTTAHCDYLTDIEQILQKISKCEVE